MRLKRIAAIMAAGMLCAPQAQAQIEIQWWHSMTGALGDRVNGFANEFNAMQKEYKVVPVYKGAYPESMTAAIAAFRAGNPPHILQVFEVGTATMMAAGKAIKPVYQLMAEAKEPFDPKDYHPAVAGYYTDRKGNMLSMPFNSSTPVFYINKDAFKKAGLDADKAPRTWKEFAAAAEKLKAAGQQCVYSTGWPSWVHIENFSAWHNLPIGTQENGIAGFNTEFRINSPQHVAHIEMLADFVKKGLMTYSGRRNEAEARFFSGECAMVTSSSAAQANIRRNAKFDFSVNFLPYNDQIKGAPQNSIIGGATLWVLRGRPAAEYNGVARFFAFLARPGQQAWWHQNTGYLPITRQAYDLSRAQGFYDRNPGTDTAVEQLTLRSPTEHSKGLRLGSFLLIRDHIENELEHVFAARKPAKAALDDAVRHGNELLRQFERASQ
jgi:sn-glycerol 3-phosphate transport system substrate-binding protein